MVSRLTRAGPETRRLAAASGGGSNLRATGEATSRPVRILDATQAFGLAVLFVGLPISEALKSVGLALAVLGFTGKLALGARPRTAGRAATAALLAFFLSAVASVAAADPNLRRPGELFTLALTVLPFVLVADSCSWRPRRRFFATMIVVGGAAAAVMAYVGHMLGDYQRLVLGSIENAVPAGEYIGAALVMSIALMTTEIRRPLLAPLLAFASGSMGIVLLMTKSRGPIYASIPALSLAVGLGLRRKRYAAAVFVTGCLAAVWFAHAFPDARATQDQVVGSGGASSRLSAWTKTVDLIGERPLTGHGLGSYADLNVIYTDGKIVIHQVNAHNACLHVACETGLLGAFTLALFLVLGVLGILRSARTAGRSDRAVSVGALSGLAFLAVAGVASVTTDAEPGMLFFGLLGLGLSPAAGRTAGP